MKRSSRNIGALLIIACLALGGYLGFRVEASRRVIDRECQRGMFCRWRLANREDARTPPSFSQIVLGARPVEVALDYRALRGDHTAAREIAAALRFFGSLEEISVGQGGDEIMTFFSGIGRQSHLTELNCFNVPITDAISPVLRGFPRLQCISFVPGTFTGRGFPLLVELVAVDFSWCPISSEGLRSIAAAPKLKRIKLDAHPHPSSSLRAAIDAIQASRPSLKIWGLERE